MTLLSRRNAILAVLAATLLISLAVPTADARMPRARAYRVGGPITLDTNLRSTSGATAWAINEYLAANTRLPALGAAFLQAEREYGVNARFLLAAAMHESAWGTSYIARVKHNLFGYNAYDRDPFRYANAYRTFAANIDATAKFIKDFYLTPGGRWWGGSPTLRSMQQYWSSSHRWGVNVSRIASSIHLASIKGGSLKFAAPVMAGQLHGGDKTAVRLAWSGGPVPTGVGFAATWIPVELDADAIAAAAAGAAGPSATAVDGAGTATAVSPSPTRPAITTAATRKQSSSRSLALALTAPSQPGTYTLQVTMLDAGGTPLPASQRVAIPSVPVRVWGNLAVSIDITPTPGGDGAVVQITNTGRSVIPAAAVEDAAAAGEPGQPIARSVVTVTAQSGTASDAAPVLLLSQPLASDLAPGASAAFSVAGVASATGQTTNWVSVGLSVLGDPTPLAPYLPVGVWLSGTAAAAGVLLPPSAPTGPSATGSPSALPTPSAAPAVAALAMPVPSAQPAPTPKLSATPKPPAAQHVTRTYSERSAAVAYRGRWSSAAGNYLGGSAAYSTTAGATATLRFTGTSVAWVGPLGPTRGRALVVLDGKAVATVNLWRQSYVSQAVLFKRTVAAGSHTLTIKVLASPGHPYVAVDGFVVRT